MFSLSDWRACHLSGKLNGLIWRRGKLLLSSSNQKGLLVMSNRINSVQNVLQRQQSIITVNIFCFKSVVTRHTLDCVWNWNTLHIIFLLHLVMWFLTDHWAQPFWLFQSSLCMLIYVSFLRSYWYALDGTMSTHHRTGRAFCQRK